MLLLQKRKDIVEFEPTISARRAVATLLGFMVPVESKDFVLYKIIEYLKYFL
jgi:hypothetical protein